LQVKNAYVRLTDENQRKTIILHIENATDEAKKERRKLIHKGVCLILLIIKPVNFIVEYLDKGR